MSNVPRYRFRHKRKHEQNTIEINNIEISKTEINNIPYFKDLILKYNKKDKINIDFDDDVLRYILHDYDDIISIKKIKIDVQFIVDVIVSAHEMDISLKNYVNTLYRNFMDQIDLKLIMELYIYLKDNYKYEEIIKDLETFDNIDDASEEILEYVMKINPYIIENYELINDETREIFIKIIKNNFYERNFVYEMYDNLRKYVEPEDIEIEKNEFFSDFLEFILENNKYQVWDFVSKYVFKSEKEDILPNEIKLDTLKKTYQLYSSRTWKRAMVGECSRSKKKKR